jgi:Ala-tRNA(Pro) deacylase
MRFAGGRQQSASPGAEGVAVVTGGSFMAIALTLQQYLDEHGVTYDVLRHAPTVSSMRTAEASHVPGDYLAKAVVLKQEAGYLLVVLPASHRLRLDDLEASLNRHVELATEQEIDALFRDCALGAVPPIGAPYGVGMIVDDSIARQPDVYFEGGDHETLVHMTGAQFARLTAGTQHGQFSHHS